MARFRAQVEKGIGESIQEPETKNQKLRSDDQKPETRNQKLDNGKTVESDELTNGSLLTYTSDDLEPVNAAGFKVPYVVREHWKSECRKKRVKLSPMLKAFLVEELGLPPGFSLEDL
jgi:hypothetical protein